MTDILVIVAHPDDELLGVGGTVKKLATAGKTVRAVILGEGLTSRDCVQDAEILLLQSNARRASKIIGYSSVEFCSLPDNRFDSKQTLDVVKLVASFIDKYKPDTVFTHYENDLNIDHRITFNAVITAARPLNNCSVSKLISFEVLSSTEWMFGDSKSFKPNFFVDVAHTLQRKIDAINCYATELKTFPHPRSTEAIEALAAYRGSAIAVKKAEAFFKVFEVLK